MLGRARKEGGKKDSCVVSVRVRPCELNVWNFNGNSVSLQEGSPVYAFDNLVLGNNQELYALAARSIVWNAMQGINGTILAYGQTASGMHPLSLAYGLEIGKTHSMMGFDENDPGIIPQAVDDVFSFIREVCDFALPCLTKSRKPRAESFCFVSLMWKSTTRPSMICSRRDPPTCAF